MRGDFLGSGSGAATPTTPTSIVPPRRVFPTPGTTALAYDAPSAAGAGLEERTWHGAATWTLCGVKVAAPKSRRGQF